MVNGFPDAEIYQETGTTLKNPIIFAGFVGAGLVGTISVDYIINKLDMKEIGFLRSKHLPPSTVFMQGRLRHPFRLYANDDGNICAIICEIIINREGLYTIASAIFLLLLVRKDILSALSFLRCNTCCARFCF